LPFGGHADPVFHGTSQAGGMGFALTPGEAPLHFSRSKNVMHVADHIFFDVANRLDDIDVSPR
ncbi:hypothetical protein GBB10_06460, partial [Bifidobacterium longum]